MVVTQGGPHGNTAPRQAMEFSRDGETWEVMPAKLPVDIAATVHVPGSCQVALDGESFWIGGGPVTMEDGSVRALKTGYCIIQEPYSILKGNL